MKITSCAIIYCDLNTLVLKVKLHGKSDDVVLRIGVGGKKGFQLHRMELISAHLFGVVPLLAFKSCTKAEYFKDLFINQEVYQKFMNSIKRSPVSSTVNSIINNMRKQPVLLTWAKHMDGDLSSLSIAERSKLKPQLFELLNGTLKKRAMEYYGSYISHQDLSARNILYKMNGQEMELKLTDFSHSLFTKDETLIDAEINSAIERIISQPMVVKQYADMSQVSKRRRFNPPRVQQKVAHLHSNKDT